VLFTNNHDDGPRILGFQVTAPSAEIIHVAAAESMAPHGVARDGASAVSDTATATSKAARTRERRKTRAISDFGPRGHQDQAVRR